jgi:hypothetical protein
VADVGRIAAEVRSRLQVGDLAPGALADQVGGDHYRSLPIQPVEYIEANALTFLEGSVVKRVTRHRRGGKAAQDIRKAIHELRLILQLVYGEVDGGK